MSKSNFKGVFVSAEILRDDRLTATDKFLLAYIINFKDGCYASDKYIAETLGVGAKTVRNSLTKLRSLKLIISASIDGKRRLVCPEIGTSMSLNKDKYVPKSGQVCPEIGQTQQGSDPCSNNNSKTNLNTNSSSNATPSPTTTSGVSAGAADSAIIAFQQRFGLSTHPNTVAEIHRQVGARGISDTEIVGTIRDTLNADTDGALWAGQVIDEAFDSAKNADFAAVSLIIN